MARPTKTTKTSESVSAPVSASVSTATLAPTPVVSKKVAAPKKEKVAKKEAVPVVPQVVEENVVVTDETDAQLTEQSNEFLSKLQQLGTLITNLKTEYRTLEKKWSREIKTAQKQSSKRKRKSGNRAPSGFVKPTRISDELAAFLGKDKGSEMARTHVTKEINAYIRSNNLQDKDNGRKINPDPKLTALLKLKKEDELTYFNLQRFMSPHFAKTVKAEVVQA
uniref:DM2 domain-containing protein n=1 Tax=viral metagenome TaxID=1070528 RepID=A0A6C0KTK5_9ZZZZ